MAGAIKITPKLFIGWLAGLGLAVLAFSQAAASAGLAIESFRPLGAGFFSWRSGQVNLSIKIFESREKANAERAIATGRSILQLAPLTPRSLWLIGKGKELTGDLPAARRAMKQAERVSRRDGAVQLWLGADNLKRGRIAAGLRDFDLMIRGDGEASVVVLPRLALIIAAPEGRRHLAPYIREDNPWLLDLIHAAVKDLPRAAPLATLLIDRGKKAPDIAHVRPAYANLMRRLLRERSYDQALRLHPLLPGAEKASLYDVARTGDVEAGEGYPPFVWDFSTSNEQGASLVGVDGGRTGIDIFGSPGTTGIAANKIVVPRDAAFFQWRVDDRAANMQSSAAWELSCLLGRAAGTTRRSVDLLHAAPLKRMMAMPVPQGCDLLSVRMQIAGGIGRTPATLVVSDLKLSDAEPKR